MLKLRRARIARAVGAALAVCLAATAHAQTSTAGQSGSAADDALLAKAATMYYSTAKAGLNGFDCAVHPDWHTVFASADPGAAISDSDSRLVLLNGVAITLHARLKGGSTLDWTPAAGGATDADSTALLTQDAPGDWSRHCWAFCSSGRRLWMAPWCPPILRDLT